MKKSIYALFFSCLVSIPCYATTYNYTTIDCPNLSSTNTRAFGVNNNGLVVGVYHDINGDHGFTYTGGTCTDFRNPLFPNATTALGVNGGGQIVGYTGTISAPTNFSYIAPNFNVISISGATASQASGVNNCGQVVGFYVQSGLVHGFSQACNVGTVTTNINSPAPGATSTLLIGANDNGTIVGYAGFGSQKTSGFVLSGVGGTFSPYIAPGTTDVNSPATNFAGIDASGNVVGYWATGPGQPTHGFFLTGFPAGAGTFTSFDYSDPNALQTKIFGVSPDAHYVVGSWRDGAGVDHGFIGVAAPPAVVSTVPSSGTGSSQSFAVTVSDPNGTSAIANFVFLINTGVNGTNACWVLYNKAANTFQLANDAGSGFSTPITLGSNNTLSNSQCTVSALNASTSTNGNNLTVNIPLSFTPLFSGTKGTFALANDTGGLSSGWVQTGTWTIPGGNQPSVVGVVPSSGSGASQTFAVTGSDNGGVSLINQMVFLVNTGVTGANGCWVLYTRSGNTLQLGNDAGNGFSPPAALGANTTLSNSQCSINVLNASSSTNGNNLTVNIPITFTAGFAGAKATFELVTDNNSQSTGYQQVGTWTVTAATSPGIVGVVPSSGSGSSQTFAVTGSDTGGASLINQMVFLVNTGVTGANGCWVLYTRSGNTLQLGNDAGNAFSSPFALGANTTLSNSQCSISVLNASSSTNGNNLTVNIPITFTAGFSGAKGTFELVTDNSSHSTGYQQVGSWTVATGPAVVGVVPASGSGPSRTFAVTVSDSGGVSAINQMVFLVNTGVSGTNGCWVLYTRSANILQLGNDAGTAFSSPVTLGTSASLSNSQCTVSALNAFTSTSGNNLTVNIPISFTSGFAGAKGTFALVTNNSSQSSGYQQAGAWTVTTGPAVVGIVPSSGSGSAQTFAVTVSDSGGATALTSVLLLVNTGVNGTNACWVLYDRPSNTLALANDGATGFSAPITIGSAGTVSNSQCTLSAASASVTTTGTVLTVNLPLSFAFSFAGAKGTFVIAYDSITNTGWMQAGNWTIPASGPPAIVGAAPLSGAGTSQTFAVSAADGGGPAVITYISFLVNNGLNGANACWVLYNHATNTLQLANDAGNGFSAPITVGTNTSVSNAQCTINALTASTSTTGENLTINIPLVFAGGFSGGKSTFAIAYDSTTNSGWMQTGSWTVQ
ncbi:MAG: hypothetical protein C5B51_27920 [Terriglobia bacterium]|nr:MAG: hypothetical protein C5B51_27920 [Terriglobia bacterium]